ncbi:hypothetical protein [Rhodoligotrophos defluvii]|uniref:hypothetical protein n=1 Tax=Rhodoligotrophos defluvii TaxID=2561934 RepID=UPI0010CA200E|nr:hypothetical protein [Rhodoligotrophos defluvii]
MTRGFALLRNVSPEPFRYVGARHHHLAQRLAKLKVPKRVLIINALPRNTMGKGQKAELRKHYGDLFKIET